MNKLPKGAKQLILGLLMATLCAAILGYQFGRSALLQQLDATAERQATIVGQSLGHLVEAQLAGPKAKDKEAMPTLIRGWQAEHGDKVRDIRVLKLGGAKLMASTREGDVENKRLDRKNAEHKTFFDLGGALRSGIKTNVEEGVFRKEEISLVPNDDKSLTVTVPVHHKDKFYGIAQLVYAPEVGEIPSNKTWPMLMVLATVLVGFVLAILFGGDEKKRVRMLAGAGLLMAVLGGFTDSSIATLEGGRMAIEEGLASHYLAARDINTKVATNAELDLYTLPSENSWDSDIYRRAMQFVDASGSLNTSAIQQDLGDNSERLKNAFLLTGALSLLVFIFFAIGWAVSLWKTIVEHKSAYAYVTPAMFGMIVLVFFPFLYGIALSFTGQTLYNTDQSLFDIWVGMENYIEILSDVRIFKDTTEGMVIDYDNFYWTAFITIMWTVCNVVIGVSVGLGLALCLNVPGMKFKPIYRAVLVLPWAIPSYVTALIWKGMFHKQFGPINQIIQLFGGEPVAWFDSVFSSFLTGIIVNGWLSFPFMMMISLGGLQSISADMYEAARLDGASKFQQFRYITVPSLKPTLVPAIIISVVWTFNLFNVIYLVSGGEPGGANEILVTQAYKIAFEKYQYGYAAAYSTVIFIILLMYGIFQNKMSNATEDIHK